MDFERFELTARRTACRNGSEVDATAHAQDLRWNHGERGKIKRAMRQRDRRHVRQLLRSAH